MQQGRAFMDRRSAAGPEPLADRQGLVTTGAVILLLGVACLILAVFASLAPTPEAASVPPVRMAPVVEPVGREPLTSGQGIPAVSAPTATQPSSATKRAKPRTKPPVPTSAEPAPTTATTPAAVRPADPGPSAGPDGQAQGGEAAIVNPDCRDQDHDANSGSCPAATDPSPQDWTWPGSNPYGGGWGDGYGWDRDGWGDGGDAGGYGGWGGGGWGQNSSYVSYGAWGSSSR